MGYSKRRNFKRKWKQKRRNGIRFFLLKKIVKPSIVDKYDHSLVLNANSEHANIDLSAFEKVYLLPYQPTSENLVSDFASIIKSKLPNNLELIKVVLSETATSFAEWHANDFL